ncbi:hypothetical protein DSECCO2_415870 [anaerobic digester metagenome]
MPLLTTSMAFAFILFSLRSILNCKSHCDSSLSFSGSVFSFNHLEPKRAVALSFDSRITFLKYWHVINSFKSVISPSSLITGFLL